MNKTILMAMGLVFTSGAGFALVGCGSAQPEQQAEGTQDEGQALVARVPVDGPTCGGFAGLPCAGQAECVDNPDDSCDPAHGGADCGGICECNVRALCVQGLHFDPSTEVCACVPDEDACATVRCMAGTHCVADGDQASCVADVFCGGIAGTACPGSGECADDPSDDCDPDNGGADCGGVCQCNIRALCVQGYHFDETAEVCGCVEDVNPCAAVSCLTGSECVVTDGEAQCVPVHGHPHPFPAPHHPHWPRMPHWHWGHR